MTPATRSRLVIVTGAAAVLLFFLHLLGATANAEAWILRGLSRPETKLSEAARSFRDAVGAPFKVNETRKENEVLRIERDRLMTEVALLREIEAENGELRSVLNYVKQAEKAPILAHVLASSPEAGTHTILLDKGSDDGVRMDVPIIAGDGIVIGKIFKLEKTTSLALLLTDSRSRLGVSIQNAAKTQGIAQGKRGLSLEMRLIPQNEEIIAGNLVVTSGIEPLVPRGLVVGTVRDVETEERNPFKTATLLTPVSYDDLTLVAIPAP